VKPQVKKNMRSSQRSRPLGPTITRRCAGFLDAQHQGWKTPEEELPPRYNLAPTQRAPIIIADSEEGVEGVLASWDLVPWFHKGPLEAKKWPASRR
jgi:putative SOS response-associated peptidase YedK